MHSKERVIRAIEFDGPDRMPHMHSYRYATLRRHGVDFAAILARYPSDYSQATPSRDTLEGSDRGSTTDEWGITWVKLNDGYMGQPKGHPLENWDNFEDYRIPDPDPSKSVFLRHHRGDAGGIASEDKYVCMYGGNLFERLQWLRGMRNVFVDLHTKNARLLELADAVVDYDIALSKIWCERGADGIVFSDDWGTQDALMVSPSLWRRIFRPRYRKMFSAVRRLGAKVHFHSDGFILNIVSDLIDLGVDVLNPQLNVHNMDELERICGGRICIRGGLDRQTVLPYGSPAQVRRHVLEAIQHFAVYDGGWIACGELGPDVPLANCEAMMKSFFELGKYRP